MKNVLLSRGARVIALVLAAGLLFTSFCFFASADDVVEMSEIFTYDDFRNTKGFREKLNAASERIVVLVRQSYSGEAITSSDFRDEALDGVFHYYFYSKGNVVTDLDELASVDYIHARSVAARRYRTCYFLNTSRTQDDWFSVGGDVNWREKDLSESSYLSVFSCDAGAILVPDETWFAASYAEWISAKRQALAFLVLAVLAAIPMLFLLFTAPGSSAVGTGRKWYLFSEVLTLIVLLSAFLLIQSFPSDFLRGIRSALRLFGVRSDSAAYVFFALTDLFFSLVILFSVSLLISRIRSRILIRSSFLFWFISKPLMRLRSTADKTYFARYRFSVRQAFRTGGFLAAECFFFVMTVVSVVNRYWTAVRVLCIVPAAVLAVWYFYVTFRDAKALNRLLDHISALREGNLSFLAPISEDDEFFGYECKLRSVGQEFGKTLQNQVAAERSKVNLITNVSHDLRTPLTSIVACADLLSKENLPDSAREYVDVIVRNSDRLNRLVADVFALSKAGSGAEKIETERLDLFVLARQIASDLGDSPESGADRIRLIGEGSAPVISNGEKLYRILQNVFENALKYSLDGTRVYVRLSRGSDTASVTVKNTASYEMTFTAEQISEQFVRGDPTRTGDGSGLGLSIARTFAEQLGAKFAITVDGDQFTASLSLPLIPEENPTNR